MNTDRKERDTAKATSFGHGELTQCICGYADDVSWTMVTHRLETSATPPWWWTLNAKNATPGLLRYRLDFFNYSSELRTTLNRISSEITDLCTSFPQHFWTTVHVGRLRSMISQTKVNVANDELNVVTPKWHCHNFAAKPKECSSHSISIHH